MSIEDDSAKLPKESKMEIAGLTLPKLDIHLDLSTSEARKSTAEIAGMAGGLLPGMPLANAAQFAAGMWSESIAEEMTWDVIRNGYGDLIYRSLHADYDPALEGPITKEMVASMTQEQMETAILYDPLFEGLRPELKDLNKRRSSVYSRVGLPLVGSVAGAMLIPGGGFVWPMVGGVAGGFVGGAVHKRVYDEPDYASNAFTMYESLRPFMQVSIDQGGGVDTAQAFAVLVASSKDKTYREIVEKQLGMTLEEALDKHNELRVKGEAESSLLYEIARDANQNVDLASSCNCSAMNFDMTQPIASQYASAINQFKLDPRMLVLGDSVMLVATQQTSVVNEMEVSPPGHGLPPQQKGLDKQSPTMAL